MCMEFKWKHHIFRSLILKIYIGCRFASANWNVLMKLSFFFPNIHLSHHSGNYQKIFSRLMSMHICVYMITMPYYSPAAIFKISLFFSSKLLWRTIKRISTINHVKFLYLTLSWCLERGWWFFCNSLLSFLFKNFIKFLPFFIKSAKSFKC